MMATWQKNSYYLGAREKLTGKYFDVKEMVDISQINILLLFLIIHNNNAKRVLLGTVSRMLLWNRVKMSLVGYADVLLNVLWHCLSLEMSKIIKYCIATHK